MSKITFKKLHNYYTYLKAIRDYSVTSSTYPPYVCIETSAVCNLSCNKCPVGKERKIPHGRVFMDMGLYKKIIDEISPFCIGVILSYMGEPLINPDIFKYVKYAIDKGLAASFYSNGVALNDQIIENIIAYKVNSVAFSVDCLPEQYVFYSKMKNIPLGEAKGHLEKVIWNIERLGKRIREVKAKTQITVIRMDAPESTPEDIYRAFWIERDVIPISGGVTDWGGKINRIKVTRKRSKANKVDKGLCSWLYGMIAVNSDGIVPMCHTDYNADIPLGDANVQTIKEIYNSRKIRDIRKKAIAQDYVVLPCSKCAYDDYFIKYPRPLMSMMIFLIRTKMNHLYPRIKKLKYRFMALLAG